MRRNTKESQTFTRSHTVYSEIIRIILKAQRHSNAILRVNPATGEEMKERGRELFSLRCRHTPKKRTSGPLFLMFGFGQSVADLFALLRHSSLWRGFGCVRRRFLLGQLGTRNLLLLRFFHHLPGRCCRRLFWFGARRWFVHLEKRKRVLKKNYIYKRIKLRALTFSLKKKKEWLRSHGRS